MGQKNSSTELLEARKPSIWDTTKRFIEFEEKKLEMEEKEEEEDDDDDDDDNDDVEDYPEISTTIVFTTTQRFSTSKLILT